MGGVFHTSAAHSYQMLLKVTCSDLKLYPILYTDRLHEDIVLQYNNIVPFY